MFNSIGLGQMPTKSSSVWWRLIQGLFHNYTCDSYSVRGTKNPKNGEASANQLAEASPFLTNSSLLNGIEAKHTVIAFAAQLGIAERSILMSLQSQSFRGDPKLEAAAVSHPAHIVPGAVGEDVAKIQQALILLDGADIDSGELASKRYGPSTANAVLSYKKKRNIINHSWSRN